MSEIYTVTSITWKINDEGDGYEVWTYFKNGDHDLYCAGNHPDISDAYLPTSDPRALDRRTLRASLGRQRWSGRRLWVCRRSWFPRSGDEPTGAAMIAARSARRVQIPDAPCQGEMAPPRSRVPPSGHRHRSPRRRSGFPWVVIHKIPPAGPARRRS
jgi:hypothetical protein